MILLSSIIQTFESGFLEQYKETILPSHRKALSVMKRCRTSASPLMLTHCNACERYVLTPHSCGHRNCPHCQSHESQQWLERQLKKRVPAEYFLLTFTLPKEFRSLAWSHQRTLYDMMIQCSWETLNTFTQNDRQLKGNAGAIAVLHTHTRRLDYHPHIHILMPAAAINTKERLWRTKNGYLFNENALAKVFRARMLDAISKAGLSLPDRYPEEWVVHCKSVGQGEKALVYLGRYLYKGVIQEKDILACKNGQVTFRYRNSKTKKWQKRTVPGATFLWLVLQHVLPKGFRRARNFGFLHPNSKRLLALLHYLLRLNPVETLAWVRKRPCFTCRHCGATMTIVKTRILPLYAATLSATEP